MALQVLAWQMEPGKELPQPTLQDDRALYPEGVVRQVLAFIGGRVAELRAKGPTPQVLGLGRDGGEATPMIHRARFAPKALDAVPVTVGVNARVVEWEYGTFEILLRKKGASVILARYHYAGARELSTGHVIIGELLTAQRAATLQ